MQGRHLSQAAPHSSRRPDRSGNVALVVARHPPKEWLTASSVGCLLPCRLEFRCRKWCVSAAARMASTQMDLQRRKTLRAAIAGWAGSPGEAERRLVAAGIDPSARGETLDAAAYVRLAGSGRSA